MNTWVMPSIEVERSSSIPLMVFTASSIFSVTSVSISAGEAPGFMTVTVIVGKSTFGKRSTPKRKKEKAPMTTIDKINIVANTGRFTQTSANHCITQKVPSSKFQVSSYEFI